MLHVIFSVLRLNKKSMEKVVLTRWGRDECMGMVNLVWCRRSFHCRLRSVVGLVRLSTMLGMLENEMKIGNKIKNECSKSYGISNGSQENPSRYSATLKTWST